MGGWVPWAWFWRRGVVLLVVGVVALTFLAREQTHVRESVPLERSSEALFSSKDEYDILSSTPADENSAFTEDTLTSGSNESPSPAPAPPSSTNPPEFSQEKSALCPDCPECPSCPECPIPPVPETCPPCIKQRCPMRVKRMPCPKPSPSPPTPISPISSDPLLLPSSSTPSSSTFSLLPSSMLPSHATEKEATTSLSPSSAPSPSESPSGRTGGPEVLQKSYRKRLAKTLGELQRQISRLAGRRAVVDAKWSLVIGGLIQELDPHVSSSSNSSWDYSAQLVSNSSLTSSSHTSSTLPRGRHVCPELYLGGGYDRPFNQHGMEMVNCSGVPPLRNVLTIVLPAKKWPSEKLNFVISQIRTLYDIPIIAITRDTNEEFPFPNTKFFKAGTNDSDAKLLNKAVALVQTPFVLLGESLEHFSNQSSLERLVRVLDDLQHVQVAGGAARDPQGHWIHGCLQQHMANYQVKYTMGYYQSKYECMYCDDLLTPFVTRTKLLQTRTFTDGLSGQALYRDWFTRVRNAGHLTVVCPDVMFFLSSHASMAVEDWLSVARVWAVQKVSSFTGETLMFRCEDVGITCTNIKAITKWYLLPPCCIDIAMEDMRVLSEFADSEGLEYELQAGSVLGALKFGSFLPWDMDHDVFVECRDFKKWAQKFGTLVKSRKCISKVKYKNIFLKVICPTFTMDIFCRDDLSKKFLPKEYANTPTSILYGGRWTKAVANPGLFARNAIGLEVLKHVQHSSHILEARKRKKSSSPDFGQPGTWLRCKNPQHHACLDKFPADGNLPYVFP